MPCSSEAVSWVAWLGSYSWNPAGLLLVIHLISDLVKLKPHKAVLACFATPRVSWKANKGNWASKHFFPKSFPEGKRRVIYQSLAYPYHWQTLEIAQRTGRRRSAADQRRPPAERQQTTVSRRAARCAASDMPVQGTESPRLMRMARLSIHACMHLPEANWVETNPKCKGRGSFQWRQHSASSHLR